MSAVKQKKPLKQIFGQVNYAWELLQAQVKLETSQAQMISGDDVSNLLQLYMRGVQKMNTLVDIRESFFKNKVTTLMSRPMVMKILNKPMVKKSQPAVVNCSSPQQKITIIKQQIIPIQSPKRDQHKQLQLKQKKQSLEMRLAYSAEQNNPDALKKLLEKHSQKQSILTQKIVKIVDSHQQRLRKRISQRKMKTITAKSKCQPNIQAQNGGIDVFDYQQKQLQINQIIRKQNNNVGNNNDSKQVVVKEFNLNDNQKKDRIVINRANKPQKSRSLQHKTRHKNIENQQNKSSKQENRKRKLSCNLIINQDQKFKQFLKQKIEQKSKIKQQQ